MGLRISTNSSCCKKGAEIHLSLEQYERQLMLKSIKIQTLEMAYKRDTRALKEELDKVAKERDDLLAELAKFKSSEGKDTMESTEELKSEVHYWKKRVHVPKLVMNLEHSISVCLEQSFNQWKEEESVDSLEVLNSVKVYEDACLDTLDKNPLLSNFSSHSAPTLTPSEVYKKANEILDKKYESDCADIQNGRTPKSISDFTIEHFKRSKGLDSLAFKCINELMATLQQLYDEGDDYGTLLCRLFQVFHPEPVSTPLTLFLTHARAEFYRIANRRSGGKLNLTEGINLIFSLFPTDKVCRGICIQQLKPEDMGVADYVLFRVCHKLAKLGLQPEVLFSKMDADNSETVEREEMIEGLKRILELAIQPEEAKCLFQMIDKNNSGMITAETFLNFINFNMHRQFAAKHYLSLSKILKALIETNKIIVIKDRALLSSLTKKMPFEIQKSHAEEVLAKACPDFSDSIRCPMDKEEFIEALIKSRRKDFDRRRTV